MQTNLDLFSLPAVGLNQKLAPQPTPGDTGAAESFANWLNGFESPKLAKKPAAAAPIDLVDASQTLAASGLVGPAPSPEADPKLLTDTELDEVEPESFFAALDPDAESEFEGQKEALATAALATANRGTNPSDAPSSVSGSESLASSAGVATAAATQFGPTLTTTSSSGQASSTSGTQSSLPAPSLQGSIETNSVGEAPPTANNSGFVGSASNDVAATNQGSPIPSPAHTAENLTSLGSPLAAPALDQTSANPAQVAPVPSPEAQALVESASLMLGTKQATQSVATAAATPATNAKKPSSAAPLVTQELAPTDSVKAPVGFGQPTAGDSMDQQDQPNLAAQPQAQPANAAPKSLLNDALALKDLDAPLDTAAELVDQSIANPTASLTGGSLSSTEAFKSDLFVTQASNPGSTQPNLDAAASMAATSQVGRVDPVVASTAAATDSLRTMSPATPEFESIAEQLRMHMSPGVSRVSFIVDPPELGRVLVRLSMQRGRLVGEISAENRDVAKTLEAGLSALKVNLQESGVNVDSLRVQQDQFLGDGDGHFANGERSRGARGDRERSDRRSDLAEVRSDSARSKREKPTTGNDGHINLVA